MPGGILFSMGNLEACAVVAGRLRVLDPLFLHNKIGSRLLFAAADGLIRVHRDCRVDLSVSLCNFQDNF